MSWEASRRPRGGSFEASSKPFWSLLRRLGGLGGALVGTFQGLLGASWDVISWGTSPGPRGG
eukprot:2262002-Pyramimonas_sp.AAC.1